EPGVDDLASVRGRVVGDQGGDVDANLRVRAGGEHQRQPGGAKRGAHGRRRRAKGFHESSFLAKGWGGAPSRRGGKSAPAASACWRKARRGARSSCAPAIRAPMPRTRGLTGDGSGSGGRKYTARPHPEATP